MIEPACKSEVRMSRRDYKPRQVDINEFLRLFLRLWARDFGPRSRVIDRRSMRQKQRTKARKEIPTK
jgi:hypothetical protein